MKIGIMGGTFDPIHNAHLALAECALIQLHLDEIWFMPDGNPPHKTDRSITDAKDRMAMVALAIEGKPGFVLSDFEQGRSGYTYTSDTLELLKEQYPEHEFYFMIGNDSLYEIETWHEPAKIMKMTTLVVADRDYAGSKVPLDQEISYLEEKYGAMIKVLSFEEIDISSTEIRELASDGKFIDRYVPVSVSDYIHEHRLYTKE